MVRVIVIGLSKFTERLVDRLGCDLHEQQVNLSLTVHSTQGVHLARYCCNFICDRNLANTFTVAVNRTTFSCGSASVIVRNDHSPSDGRPWTRYQNAFPSVF